MGASRGPSRALFAAIPLLVVGAGVSACRDRPPAAARPVVILQASDILSLDPNDEIDSVTAAVLNNVYEPLVGFDEDLKTRMILAESYEHPEPERWRFHLRGGIRFHDGTPLDAEVARDALLRLRASPTQEATAFLGHVAEVAAVDRLTLDVVTREPRALLASLPFVFITRPPPSRGAPPVGTGPYVVKEWVRGRHVLLERVDGYWGGAARIARARFEDEPDAERRAARVFEGSADIAHAIPPERASQVPGGSRIARRRGITVRYIGFDLRPARDNPFTDLRVRKAFHLALDRDALVRGVAGAATVATQPVAPLIFGFDPGLSAPARDVTEARRLLAEAGHGKGLRARLDLADARLTVARLIQAQVKEAGLDLELAPLPGNGVYDRAEAGESRLFFVGWDCTTGEATEFFEFCLHTPGGGYGQGNFGRYSNRELDAITEGSAAILDQRQRQAALQRVNRMVMAELPVLPLYVEDDLYAVRAGVRFRPRADSELRLLDIALEE
ncbi:MAG TPA: ABC transporter substrate-binding protein [Vicinamibacteria bacterium]|nr:ABC transporter substrate-binding protein [Vicinamibacteria bacterium]